MKKVAIMTPLIYTCLLAATVITGCSGKLSGVYHQQEEQDSVAEPSENGQSIATQEVRAADDAGMKETAETEPKETMQQETESTEIAAGEENEYKAPFHIKGIYVAGAMAGTERIDELIDLVDRTELNSMVIDVKNDEGRVTYEMDSPGVTAVGAAKNYIGDIDALVEKCKEHDIYLIARIVAFKDPYLAEQKPELSLHTKSGEVFRDKDGLAWVNPYKREVWEYLAEIAANAVTVGFDEIQFDYIRFSTDKGMKNVDFGEEAAEMTKEEVVTEFTAYAADKLHELGASVSADVYGTIIDSEVDASIVGQNYYEMAKYLDYLSPMVYPSHYGTGNYGLAVPDAQPYETVYRSMKASREVLAGVTPQDKEKWKEERTVSGNGTVSDNNALSENEAFSEGDLVTENNTKPSVSSNQGPSAGGVEHPETLQPSAEITADVRPWLQDFTATWVKGHITYGPEQIREQIQAVYDAGYEEWILWNASSRYTEDGLLTADGQPYTEPEA